MDKFVEFSERLHRHSGIDLSQYKRAQMERRLTALMERAGFDDFLAYAAAIEIDDKLLAQLLDRMTINVSEFFRNAERWDGVLAKLQSIQDLPVKIWSAGCSTGEEPYTLAILMEEVLATQYQITATDLDAAVLQHARNASYKAYQVKQVPDDYRTKCFAINGEDYIIKPRYREHIEFTQHNLLSATHPAGFHLIVCRNVLIYFTDEGKHTIFDKFYDALLPGGYLFVGSTEQLLQASRHGFASVGPFLYQKISP